MAKTALNASFTSPVWPAPLTAAELAKVAGVLGRIARERAADYADHDAAHDAADLAVVHAADYAGRTTSGDLTGVLDRPPRPSLERALRAPDPETGAALRIVAEIKRQSPSQGAIAQLDPLAAARDYQAGGAAAISVLTEPRHFGGELGHLREVARFIAGQPQPLPLLRKEFVVHPAQLVEAAEAGASAVLLIAGVTGKQTAAYLAFARAIGLEALIEVHDEAELELAVASGASLLGVNNRDLASLQVDLTTAPRLIKLARRAGFSGVTVAESGYRTRDDLRGIEGLADAALVGTSLAASGQLAAALRTLRGL